MFDNFYQISDLSVFLLLNGIAILISIFAVFLVRCFMPLHLRYQDNSVVSSAAQLISLVYGVLAGLTALYLINNNNFTTDAIQREASAVANIYRDSNWLSEPTKANIQIGVKKYLLNVINIEWPKMQKGESLTINDDILIDGIFNELKNYQIKNDYDQLIIGDTLNEIKKLYNARQQRIQMSYTQLDAAIWIVVIIGTILTLCINYLFGINFYLHIVIVTAAAIMTSSMIFLLVVLDRPFQGEHIIEPTPLQDVYQFIERQK